MNKFLILILVIFSTHANSEVIEFPEAELAKESVLPIFDKVEVVKSRSIPTEGRIEVGAGFGLNLTEALYDNKNYNLNLAYNLTNLHAVVFTGLFAFDGLSTMGEDLAAGKGLSGGRFDASLAPYPKSYMGLSYQLTGYYGKISLSKNFVMNVALYGMAGLVNVQFSDASSFGGMIGIGQKFYFNENLALRFDLLGLTYSGADPTSATNLNPTLVTEQVSSSSLDEILYFRTLFNFGLVYLL